MAKGGTGIAGFTVQEITDDDRIWISKVLRDRWGEARIVSRGRVHDASQLPGFIAMNDGQPLGLLTYHLCENDCEIVTLDALAKRTGIGNALLDAIQRKGYEEGSRRLWLVTTNDNRGGPDLLGRTRISISGNSCRSCPRSPKAETIGY